MAKKKLKGKNRVNNWRQKQYLKVGVVMLPDIKTERRVVTDVIARGQYKKEEEKHD